MNPNQNQTITLTWGDVGESFYSMEKIGQLAPTGYTHADLIRMEAYFKTLNCQTQIYHLNQRIPQIAAEDAWVLVISNGLNCLLPDGRTSNDLWTEQVGLNWDRQALMWGRVVQKKARYNLCFGPTAQNPVYKEGKGRIIAWQQVPLLNHVRTQIETLLDPQTHFVCESNYYYDTKTCGIGYHGDRERRRAIGMRLGQTIPLVFQWFKDSKPIGSNERINLANGDIYVMSAKAIGFDCAMRTRPTLRHAAGADHYTTLKP